MSFACSGVDQSRGGRGAEAQTTTTSYPVSGGCTGAGQLCNNIVTLPVTTTGALQVQFVGGPSGSTGFFNLGPVTGGTHTLGLQAEGQLGGCNSGNLVSWAGTAQVTTCTGAIPALSDWGLAGLLVLVGFGALRALRRQRPAV